jgi:hypothetical protein
VTDFSSAPKSNAEEPLLVAKAPANEGEDWDKFCGEAAESMRLALDNKITLEQLTDFFEAQPALSNLDLRQYIIRMVWEIDGSRKYYLELMQLFESRAKQSEILQYLES